MISNYPYVTFSNNQVVFHDGSFLSLPSEYLRKKNHPLVSEFYKHLLSKNNEEVATGTDPIGFDFVIYQNLCNIGILLGLSHSSLSNNNRKKFPNHKFEKNYFINRVINDKKIQNFEEFIPVEIVTQNIHEIRNLNFKISSSIDEILNYSDDSEWEDKFDKADDNIKKIYVSSRLTKFILDNIRFYMPDYFEKLKPNYDKSFSIHKSVNKIVKIYRNDFKKRRSQIDFEGTTYKQIRGEKELFEIILMLLVENAIKYSRDINTIAPKVKIKEHGPDTVEISIQSYGTLIPNEDIPKLFSRGYRSTVHKLKEGTGMGLHNASMLIKLFSGDIKYSKVSASVEDTKSGWNIFTIVCRETI